MVFYFTATGNSLYIARSIGDDIFSIPQELKQPGKVYRDPSIGIVCPTYGHDIPVIVRRFLSSARFETEYFYMIFTYGTWHCGVAQRAKDYLQTLGIRPSYLNSIAMVDNALPGYDMDEERGKEPDKKIEEHLGQILQDLRERRSYILPASQEDLDHHQNYLKREVKLEVMDGKDLFEVVGCISCGICGKVCPIGAVQIPDGGTVSFDYRECFACLACAHACPVKAIRLHKMPEKNIHAARFRNQHVTLEELIRANHQPDIAEE